LYYILTYQSPGYTYLCSIKTLTSDGGYGFTGHINISLARNDKDGDDDANNEDKKQEF
jgi:hypothetical protein